MKKLAIITKTTVFETFTYSGECRAERNSKTVIRFLGIPIYRSFTTYD